MCLEKPPMRANSKDKAAKEAVLPASLLQQGWHFGSRVQLHDQKPASGIENHHLQQTTAKYEGSNTQLTF